MSIIDQVRAFDNFWGRFTLFDIDTKLYELIGKYYHQRLGIPIQTVNKIVRLRTGKKLILGLDTLGSNLMVETGRELHAALMINDTSDYGVYTYPQYIHIGDGTTPPAADDWALDSPWVAGGEYQITSATIVTISHCAWEATIASGDSGTCAEAGIFLRSTAPSGNPQGDPAQRPYSMLHRALFNPAVVKAAGSTKVVKYEAIF